MALAAALTLCGNAWGASTVLTITCDAPRGMSMIYGVTQGDLLTSIVEHKPTPAPKLYAPHADGFAKAVITIHSDRTAAVTYLYPHKLGGTETHDMRLLWPLNKIAISLLDLGVDGADAQLVTFYPQQRVAFFTGNTDSGYIGKDGKNGDELFSYSFFARCQWDGSFKWHLTQLRATDSETSTAACRTPPLECASAKNANQCADILLKRGKNPFEAFGYAGCEPVYRPKGASH